MGEEQADSEKGGVDLISELPDVILSSILSLLSMKDEVKTSILSSRWRYLWASRPNLEFDLHTMMVGTNIRLKNGLRDEEGLRMLNSEFAMLNSEFAIQVGKFLQLYLAPKIYSFKVSYCFNQESSSHLDRWIEFAVARGVELLKITLSFPLENIWSFPPYLGNPELYTFPCCLLVSHEKTSCLKHLQLKLCNLECPPNFSGFNTLVTVDLQHVKLNESSLESFFSSCVLQVLIMRKCTLPAILKATGPNLDPCVNLKCLEVIQCLGVRKMLVFAPKLTSFTYSGSMVKFLLYKVRQLSKLFINFEGRLFHESEAQTISVVTNLPEDIPHLKSLFLPLTTEMTMLPAKIASYVNLKELELEAFSRASVDFLWIGSTIDALPLLSKLRVMLDPVSHRTQEGVRPMVTSGSPHNQLKEVLITGFVPFFYQTELVIYLLKNCVALERMTIDPKFRIYDMDWELIHLNEFRVWRIENGEKEQFYELIHREVPRSAGLVTIL